MFHIKRTENFEGKPLSGWLTDDGEYGIEDEAKDFNSISDAEAAIPEERQKWKSKGKFKYTVDEF